MSYNPQIHKRRSIRLKGYDYSQAGLYFITICVQDRQCLFGKIVNDEMILNEAGNIVNNEWQKLQKRFTGIELHEFVVMPNHFHGILEIVGAPLVGARNNVITQNDTVAQNDNDDDKNGQPQSQEMGQPQGIAPTVTGKTIGDVIDAFKSITTVEYIRGVKQYGWQPFRGKLWQRNYYEHIIRNGQSYETIAHYILNNPAKWRDDKFYAA